MVLCDTLNFFPGVIFGVALDEDDFGAASHFRRSGDGRFDVAGFISGGDDH